MKLVLRGRVKILMVSWLGSRKSFKLAVNFSRTSTDGDLRVWLKTLVQYVSVNLPVYDANEMIRHLDLFFLLMRNFLFVLLFPLVKMMENTNKDPCHHVLKRLRFKGKRFGWKIYLWYILWGIIQSLFHNTFLISLRNNKLLFYFLGFFHLPEFPFCPIMF